jgi:hypothetical protein
MSPAYRLYTVYYGHLRISIRTVSAWVGVDGYVRSVVDQEHRKLIVD